MNPDKPIFTARCFFPLTMTSKATARAQHLLLRLLPLLILTATIGMTIGCGGSSSDEADTAGSLSPQADADTAPDPSELPGEEGVRATAAIWEQAWLGGDEDTMRPLLFGSDTSKDSYAELLLSMAAGFKLNRVMLDTYGEEVLEQATGEPAKPAIAPGVYNPTFGNPHIIEMQEEGQAARRKIVLTGMWPMEEYWRRVDGHWRLDADRTLGQKQAPQSEAQAAEEKALIESMRDFRVRTEDFIKRIESGKIDAANLKASLEAYLAGLEGTFSDLDAAP
jgi:hypothetical protein